MPNSNQPEGIPATPAARAAAALLDILDDPTTPEVVRLALIATLRGMASTVAEAVLDKPEKGESPKVVSEEQTLAHLPRWIANAERLGVRPRPGALLPFVRTE